MATPANRVPVRIARGSKASLDTAITAGDLKEGEICYATDENGIYVVEGGVLTQAGADLAASSIGDLSDVTLTSAAVGEVLRYDGSAWVDAQLDYTDLANAPADPTLDSVSTTGATTDNDLSVGDLFTVQGDGAAQDGRLKLNCSANTHGVTIQSPPHSDAATYSLILPSSAGTAGQVLTSQGGAQLTWENAGGGGTSTLGDLTDVDLSTPATDGQIIAYSSTSGNWEPVNQSGGGGGAVDSVNGETGVVSLGIQDMDDFVLNDLGNPQFAYNKQIASSPFRPDPGNYMDNSAWLRLNYTDANGATLFNVTPGVAGSFWYSSDSGANWTELTYTSATLEASTVYFQAPSPNLTSSSVLIAQFNPATTPKAPLADGDVLQWDATASEFNPAQLPNAAETRTLLGIGEYADDAAAGTGGVTSGAMYYNTTSGDYRLKT